MDIEAIRKRHKETTGPLAAVAFSDGEDAIYDRAELLNLIDRADLRYEIDWEELEADINKKRAISDPVSLN